MLKLMEYLNRAVELGASDVFMVAGAPVSFAVQAAYSSAAYVSDGRGACGNLAASAVTAAALAMAFWGDV